MSISNKAASQKPVGSSEFYEKCYKACHLRYVVHQNKVFPICPAIVNKSPPCNDGHPSRGANPSRQGHNPKICS